MKALQLIIAREYSSRVKTKAFILTTILTPILMIAVVMLPTIIMTMKNTDISTVYVIDKTGMYAPLFKDAKDYSFQILSSEGESRNTGEGYALLQINADLSKMPKAVTFFSQMQKPPTELTNYINSVLSEAVKDKKLEEYAANKNIDKETFKGMQQIIDSDANININTYRLDETGETKDTVSEVASVVGMMFTFIMFFFVMMYGSLVVQSVVEEKTNRIIEVIISSVKPFDLMMGKIISIALMGLTQIGAWIIILAIGMGIYSLFGGLNISAESMGQAMEMANHNKLIAGAVNTQLSSLLSSISWFQVISCFILYFIGGYLLYAAFFAMFGSAANDSQEAQQFITPLIVILMIAFYVGVAASKNPEGSAAIWGSIIPFTSPVVMMVRTPFEVPLWHILLSLVLLYATAILMTMLAAKIYRTGILMYGKKVNFTEIFKWLSYK